jgi:uncharacterized protein YcfL
MTRNLLWAPALTAAVLLSACSSTPRGSQNQYEGAEGMAQMHRIEGNQALAKRLEIRDPRMRKLADGRSQVQFDLHNRHSTAVEFAWAIDWFGADGFQISDSSRHWEPVAIGGNGSHVLTIVAPTPHAVAWRLQVTSRDEVH